MKRLSLTIITVCLSVWLAFANMAQAVGLPVAECGSLFANREKLLFPQGWGFSAQDAQDFYDLLGQEERNDLWIVARLADYLEQIPHGFYDELGIVSSFEAEAFLKRSAAEEVLAQCRNFLDLNRIVQFVFCSKAELNWSRSIPSVDNMLILQKFTKLFEGLPAPQPWRLQPIKSNRQKIKQYLEKQRKNRPSLQTLLQHSPLALMSVADFIYSSAYPHLPDETAKYELRALWQDHIKGQEIKVPFDLEKPFNLLKSFAKGEKNETINLNLMMIGLEGLIDEFARFIAETQKKDSHPVEIYLQWAVYSEQLVFVDSDLGPFLKRLFVETVFDRPHLSGLQIKNHLRRNLQTEIRELRSHYKSYLKASSAKPESKPSKSEATGSRIPVPTRDDRLRAYAEFKEQNQLESESRKVTKPDSSSLSLFQALLNSFNPAPEPRGNELPASADDLTDGVYGVHLIRTGLNYRLMLSQPIIDQFRSSAREEIPKYKDWMEAIQLGPAADNGQSGWKKLKAPFGIYNWEIKITGSPWRILGYRDGDKIWHFEKFYSHR